MPAGGGRPSSCIHAAWLGGTWCTAASACCAHPCGPPLCAASFAPSAGPSNDQDEVQTSAGGGAETFAGAYHAFGMEWALDSITSERSLIRLLRASAGGAGWHSQLNCLAPPSLCCPAAVFVDRQETQTFRSAGTSAGSGGWFAAADGAPASAPFDAPFSLIL